MEILLFMALAGFASASLTYFLFQPRMAADKKRAMRLSQFARMETDTVAKHATRDRLAETVKRRRTIQNSLKEIDERQKARSRHAARPSLSRRLEQSGIALTERRFVVYSACLGATTFLFGLVLSGSLLLALGTAVFAGLGIPRFALDFLRKRRQKQFIEEFPNAIDLIVRGIKSGLPVNDTFKMISTEAADPVKTEFRKVVEGMQLGMPIGDAVERLFQNMPMSETNFFSIVITIQAQAGGNLAEALGNLSRVLRDRKKMKAKIQAMSTEAKASAAIIGCLPIVVATMMSFMAPNYIAILFNHPTGHMILVGGLLWMAIGVLIMRQMINFDF